MLGVVTMNPDISLSTHKLLLSPVMPPERPGFAATQLWPPSQCIHCVSNKRNESVPVCLFTKVQRWGLGEKPENQLKTARHGGVCCPKISSNKMRLRVFCFCFFVLFCFFHWKTLHTVHGRTQRKTKQATSSSQDIRFLVLVSQGREPATVYCDWVIRILTTSPSWLLRDSSYQASRALGTDSTSLWFLTLNWEE